MNVTRTIPKDFTPVTIEFGGADHYLEVATELLEELRECNHPSGKFFESLGACIDRNSFWEIQWEGVKMRRATAAELLENPSRPERIREDCLPLKGRIRRHAPL